LLILGGEACPPELAERLAVEGREVWNTYGPTEVTVVACAAQLTGEAPVRIGLPLDGWDLAVVDADGDVVPMGGTGELVIGGVVPDGPDGFDASDAQSRLRTVLPPAVVPLLVTVDSLPTRTSGKVDRAALAWPLPLAGTGLPADLSGTEAWLAERWADVLGAPPSGPDEDFFTC